MKALSKLSPIVLLVLAAGIEARAGEAEDAVIARVVAAYGGEKLTDLRSLRLKDHFKQSVTGQGYTPEYSEYTHIKSDRQVDVVNNRSSVEAWGYGGNFPFHARTVSIADDIAAINYFTMTYRMGAAPGYYAAFGAGVRGSDTLLAYELWKRSDEVELAGESVYLGTVHDVVSMEIPNSPVLSVYVNRETGLISKITRELDPWGTGAYVLTYRFSDYEKADGLTYAAGYEFYVGTETNLVTLSRVVTANTVADSVFALEPGLQAEPERVDVSQMTVEEVAPGFHHVGQGGGYNLFVDAGDYVIGVGGVGGLEARLTAYREAVGTEKPLRYQIFTHHHYDHMSAVGPAHDLGATLVAPSNAAAIMNMSAGREISGDRLMLVDGRTTLGPLEILPLATTHTERHALVYAPAQKIAFQADHYNGTYVDVPSPATPNTVSLKTAIEGQGLDVTIMLSAHGRKQIPWSEFEAAAESYDPDPCPSNRPICR